MALLGLMELGLHLRFAGAAPRLEEWQALRPAVERWIQPETLIVVAPAWAEPNARFALGDALMPLSHVARPDESGFAEALEISILGQTAPELLGWQLESQAEEGRFLLRRWRNPNPAPAKYDFLAHLEPTEASVELRRKGTAQACRFTSTNKVSNGDLHGHPTFPKRRFLCPGGADWSFVGRTVVEDQHYRPRACLWAHPPGRGELVVQFASVPIGSTIHGYGALPYFFEREIHGAPVELSVFVGGEPIGTWKHLDGEGWKPFEFSTARFHGQQLPVEFRVRSRKAWRRDFCFQADVR